MNPESSLAGKTLAVIGGGQGWGLKIAKRSRRFAERVDIVEQDTGIADRKSIIKAADGVFFAAPDTVIPTILREVRHLLEGKCVMDCATSKDLFERDLFALSQDASVCSTHPNVRPRSSSRNQNCLIMPVGENAETATQVAEDIFRALHMRLVRFPFERHGVESKLTQFSPHLVQRVLAATMGQVLKKLGMTIGEVSDGAPANFLLTAQALGRVEIQEPRVSAGIIAAALRSSLGRDIFRIMHETLNRIEALSADPQALEKAFLDDAERLDPDGTWRQHMDVYTDMQVETLTNLATSPFLLDAGNDRKGLLADIAAFLAAQGHNMTAIQSQTLDHEVDEGCDVRFALGLERQDVDQKALEEDCRENGWAFRKFDPPKKSS